METSEQSGFDELYRRHLRLLKLQGKSAKTIEVKSCERCSSVDFFAGDRE